MSAPVRLLLGFHAHQPVGNFPHVIDAAVLRCYRPFLEALERHPKIQASLHVSGWLLDYLLRNYPADIARIVAMVYRGQLEIIGGGDTEPVLAALGERDKREQLRELTARIESIFGVQPRGAWLAERVWESSVAPALADCALRFSAVDDYHFLAVGKSSDDLTGYYTTEESGKRLDLFPISESLRYMIPFSGVAELIGALERMPDGAAAIYFDDIEKFGVWPDTYEWVYERGWLEELLCALEVSQRITTQTFGDFHRRNASRGLIYLPATSYAEMTEWTLPPSGARRLRTIADRSRGGGTLAEDKPFLRGATWKNFFLKYPESNWMHKRVQQASRRFHTLPSPAQTAAMRSALHRAQANDAYWHGLFGGIYLPFLRRSVYANLAALESQLDEVLPRPPSARGDIDLDGRGEIALRGGRFLAIVKPHDGGFLRELTDYPLAHNFADVLARREERYYDIIRAGGVAESVSTRGQPASIHERVGFVDKIDLADLESDTAPRGMFLDTWYDPERSAGAVIHYDAAPIAGQAAARCAAKRDGFTIVKTYRIERDTLLVRYRIEAARQVTGALAVQLNIAMPSCEGAGGMFTLGGESLGGFATRLAIRDAGALTLEDSVLGGKLELAAMPACELRAEPLYTVSQSEWGFEKIMQATTITLSWVVALSAGERAERSIMLRCATTTSSNQARADEPAAHETDTFESGT